MWQLSIHYQLESSNQFIHRAIQSADQEPKLLNESLKIRAANAVH